MLGQTLLLLVGLLTIPGLASAQDLTAKRDSAVAKLRTGQQVRISAEGMQRLVGKAGVASNDTLDFAQEDMVRRIPIQTIDTLWTRGGSSRNGALIGAGALMVLSIIARAAWKDCDGSCTNTATDVVGQTFIAAAIGAGIGALIGGSVQSWKTAYP